MIHFVAWGVEVKVWPGEVLGLFMFVATVWFFWKAQHDQNNPIDLFEMLTWPGTKHTSLIFCLTLWSGLAGIWIILDFAMRGKLTTEMFLGFLGIMICGKGMTEFANAWKNKAPTPAPPAPSQQFVANADSVNAAPVAPVVPPTTPPTVKAAVAPPKPRKPKPKRKR